ncbi:MAG TPA: glycosyltransferase family 4 protein [Candidatus Desulfaltia sp.]|nr:glycosyltransferase family 4 protein [Candidatus Desulfaltia sp.]
MRIAALLPHVEVFGGVRRYLEIGNALTRRGHGFTLFTPAGKKPDWLEYRGEVRSFEAVTEAEFDIGLCSEYSILKQFDALKARAKCFYFVLEGHKKEKEVARRGYHLLGNSEGICRRVERKYGRRCFRAPGGINPEIFFRLPEPESPAPLSEGQIAAQSDSGQSDPGREFKILCYGRIYKKRKGVRQVIKAVEKLHRGNPHLLLIFFDSLVGGDRRDPRPLVKTSVPSEFYLDLPQARMAWLFAQADMFASAERRAGWSNTTAEAMACRLPVVCTASGTRDFAVHEKTALVVPFTHPWFLARQIKRLIDDPGLRLRLANAGYQKIREFTWDALAERLEATFRGFLSGNL